MKKMMTICLGVLFLSGCFGPSVEDMVEDRQLLKQVLNECRQMGFVAREEEKCKNALKAQGEIAKNALQGFVQ